MQGFRFTCSSQAITTTGRQAMLVLAKSPIDEMFNAMRPVKGEKRTVNKCNGCGELFGRRYIPYGIGHGMTVNPCICIVTNNQSRVGSETLATKTP